MNASGVVAGFFTPSIESTAPPSYSAALYQNGQYVQLPSPDDNPMNDYRATGINNLGQVVGYEQESDGLQRPIVWNNQQPTFLGAGGAANGINDQGWVVGGIGAASGNTSIPVLWRDGTMTSIPMPANAISGTALAVNNAGQVLVNYGGAEWLNGFFIWDNGVETTLALSQDAMLLTYVTGMNDSGTVVGTSAYHAVYWVGGQIYDLNDLIPADSGWTLTSSTGINDAGDIIGYGTFGGLDEPFLLSPTGFSGNIGSPEPTTLTLLTLATPLLLKRRSRRQFCTIQRGRS